MREHYSFLQKNLTIAKARGIKLDPQKQPDYDDVVRASQHFVLIQIQL